LLFAQHGWADDNRAMVSLAQQLVAPTEAEVIAPSLGYLQTWLRIAPLVDRVEQIAAQHLEQFPTLPWRIIGHSMGGLIWLEVLHRHPDWWPRVHSLVLLASPVGGADLGRILDPVTLGVGIAKDLGTNRKPMAEAIAAKIPTLIVAGDLDGGSDGTIPLCSTKFPNAQFVCLPGLAHATMKNHPSVVTVVRDFWDDFSIGEAIDFNDIVRLLHQVPGITDGHLRHFGKAKLTIQLATGGAVYTWKNAVGIEHVYVTCPRGKCLYAGFVGWKHRDGLRQTLAMIEQTYIKKH
jgi:pimeloyl-ACP methyl ester carboxylesterase